MTGHDPNDYPSMLMRRLCRIRTDIENMRKELDDTLEEMDTLIGDLGSENDDDEYYHDIERSEARVIDLDDGADHGDYLGNLEEGPITMRYIPSPINAVSRSAPPILQREEGIIIRR